MSDLGPDEDPGWRLSAAMFLWLVPGYVRLGARRGRRDQDVLTNLRQAWVMFVVGTVLYGVVVAFMGIPPIGAAWPWLVALALYTVASIAGVVLIERGRPLVGVDARTLATSYRSRFFLRVAFAQSVALMAFVAVFLAGRWWLYWVALPVTLVRFASFAPTAANLRRDQQALRDSGCGVSLVAALRSPSR